MTDDRRTPINPNPPGPSQLTPVTVLYTNWRGETAVRRIRLGFAPPWFGSTEWHPEPQWFLTAADVDKGEVRDWAMAGFKAWGEKAVAAALADAGGWRPIETAPLGKAHVLVGRPGLPPIRAWYQDDRWWMHGCGPCGPGTADLTGAFVPTHWMPLPEGPPPAALTSSGVA